jgi:hypothetical protein
MVQSGIYTVLKESNTRDKEAREDSGESRESRVEDHSAGGVAAAGAKKEQVPSHGLLTRLAVGD